MNGMNELTKEQVYNEVVVQGRKATLREWYMLGYHFNLFIKGGV